ncbi:hypothetical protein [Actinomadura gamaensis]|uniref:Uncharacterized protein n=1 Tax=Actinomadura gamaensis TaxID=1763541 RepID=A0ABV9U4Y7_9ACTN
MALTVLIVLAALALWLLSLLSRPITGCRRCGGRTVVATRTPGRVRACRACRGTGYRRRIGATTVHRLYWTIRNRPHPETKHHPHTQPTPDHHDGPWPPGPDTIPAPPHIPTPRIPDPPSAPEDPR